MPLLREISDAHRRLRGKVLRTPLVHSRWLSGAVGGGGLAEAGERTAHRLFRGPRALNKLLWLREQGIEALPVTASTGNHGQGFARALHLLDMQGKVFLPTGPTNRRRRRHLLLGARAGASMPRTPTEPKATSSAGRRERDGST
ncbi:MAG: hypothetical protein U5K31_12755 [Balneolaceae bacterium]|nr:hypothetical protein [Balneolaceae bacterium]